MVFRSFFSIFESIYFPLIFFSALWYANNFDSSLNFQNLFIFYGFFSGFLNLGLYDFFLEKSTNKKYQNLSLEFIFIKYSFPILFFSLVCIAFINEAPLKTFESISVLFIAFFSLLWEVVRAKQKALGKFKLLLLLDLMQKTFLCICLYINSTGFYIIYCCTILLLVIYFNTKSIIKIYKNNFNFLLLRGQHAIYSNWGRSLGSMLSQHGDRVIATFILDSEKVLYYFMISSVMSIAFTYFFNYSLNSFVSGKQFFFKAYNVKNYMFFSVGVFFSLLISAVLGSTFLDILFPSDFSNMNQITLTIFFYYFFLSLGIPLFIDFIKSKLYTTLLKASLLQVLYMAASSTFLLFSKNLVLSFLIVKVSWGLSFFLIYLLFKNRVL